MSWQRSVAIVGVWIGTGITSIAGEEAVTFVSLMAAFATFIIALANTGREEN